LPQPYQGVAYAEMVATEEPFEERVIRAIFEEEDFRKIQRSVLFEAYVALCKQHERKFVMSDRKLFRIADALIAKHGWEIERAEITEGKGADARKRRVFANSGLLGGHDKTDTRDRCIVDDDKTSRPRNVGPDID
jgi:hypothetical protein